jgi:hypothetical protein
MTLPRYVIGKQLAGGKVAFYYNVPTLYRAMGCSIANEPLGTDYSAACGPDGKGGRAAALNALFDEWFKAKNGEPLPSVPRHGTVDGYSANSSQASDTARRFPNDRDLTMSAVCWRLPTW